ncbi:5-oxoprolinase subunit PxpB [Clostridium sp. C105KSO13]|uniref:5-oxoprolinase subunit PxpB n=1 Tax=Clostridium sp. C105KSO13 TaxID=1776045 RepID=UPI00074075C7|nr:5-oxoprolinase subunit PxpB [Clostridium sp. C105KSO13]CUX19375.1 Kinase A inhibitor [Clostridium sp. C105KSO13]
MDAKILIAGDSAISVQLGEDISMETNQMVRGLFSELTSNPIDGIVELASAYASLMIYYKPETIRYEELAGRLHERLDSMSTKSVEVQKTQIVKELPVCYGGELGPDLEDCAAYEQVSVEKFIRIHSQHEYYVYMLGVAPGHPYMARFKEPFHFKRRETPRVRIPARSIVVMENQSNLIPFEQPCGWNIIGATPLTPCEYSKEDPFLIHAGDWVRYVPISAAEYEKIRSEVKKGIYRLKSYERVV